jgi:ABC-type antimicrobial peptide transport system permease subunit
MMRLYRRLVAAVRALRRNVMRAVLTTLGIIIGVAAVIAMVVLGQGVSALVAASITSMGANNLIIMPGAAASGGVSFGAGTGVTLTPQDWQSIIDQCPSIDSGAPIIRARGNPQVVFGSKNWVPQSIVGTTVDYLEVRQWTALAEGECFTDQDVRNGAKVCVVGQTLVRELFDGQSPLGREVRIQNIAFRVVGVLKPKGANMMGMDQDDIVLAPWTTIKFRVSGAGATGASAAAASGASQQVNTLNQIYPGSQTSLYPVISAVQAADTPLPVRFANIDSIQVASPSAEQTPSAIKEVTALLRERHRLKAGEPDDFQIRDMTEILKTLSSTSTLMTTLLLVVAAISLVVGGVGIMNIMLVSVTERTREIGLRMAVGARGRDILYQFLLEAVLLCLAGGAVGIIIGRTCSLVVSRVLKWPTALSIPAILAAVAVSAGVGVVFGFYPAWKASRLDPIEALRYE